KFLVWLEPDRAPIGPTGISWLATPSSRAIASGRPDILLNPVPTFVSRENRFKGSASGSWHSFSGLLAVQGRCYEFLPLLVPCCPGDLIDMDRLANILRHRPHTHAQPHRHRRRSPLQRPMDSYPVVKVAPQPQRPLQPPLVPRDTPGPTRQS